MLASELKRTILRKDPTFNEADYGFRGFGELLRMLGAAGSSTCGAAARRATPRSPSRGRRGRRRRVRAAASTSSEQLGTPQLSGLKTQLRKREPDFSEKRFGFDTFLSFVKAARTRGLIEMDFDEGIGDYRLHVT